MQDVLFISDSIARSIDRASILSRAFNLHALSPRNVQRRQFQSAKVIVFDLILTNGSNALIVKEALKTSQSVFVYYSSASSLEKKQAEALDDARLLDRAQPVESVVAELRNLLRRNQMKPPSHQCSASVNKAADCFEGICLSAVLNGQISDTTIEETSNVISGTLSKHSLGTFLEALQEYHSHTTRHSLLVAAVTADFCERLQMPMETRELMISSAIVHDIGKTTIPLAILDKPGKLSETELALVKTHPRHGYRILAQNRNIDERVKRIALEHHEFLDGSGYPDQKTADDLGTETRIMTICDVYSALIEKRSYKPALPHSDAISILEGMGGKLDQKLVREFKASRKRNIDFASARTRASA